MISGDEKRWGEKYEYLMSDFNTNKVWKNHIHKAEEKLLKKTTK